MSDKRLWKVGVIGAVPVLICCIPLLVTLAGAAGLSNLIGTADFVPLMALAALLALPVCLLVRRK